MRNLFSIILIFLSFIGIAQNPVKWTYTTKDAGNCQVDLIFTGIIDEGWCTYSQFLETDDGPFPTSFSFQEGGHYKLVGKAAESGEKTTAFDNVFGTKLSKFKHKAIFTQRIEVKDPTKLIGGYMTYMVCNEEMCLPPKDVDFTFKMPALTNCGGGSPAVTPPTNPAGGNNTPDNGKQGSLPIQTPGTNVVVVPAPGTTTSSTAENIPNTPAPATNTGSGTESGGYSQSSPYGLTAPEDAFFKGFFDTKRDINAAQFVNNCSNEVVRSDSLWWVFVGGFLGGLLALLTPCVFPMIPLTVTFFTKRSKDRKTGLRNAILYGVSIVLIYVTIGIGITMLFGASKLNEMSTDMYFNLLFFAVFVIFALSFFGLFEITLPSSWVNKSDNMADKGGLIGIFFMAFTLALVSFSCTGPIVGTLLVETVKGNAGADILGIPARPLIGLTGFGLALALPFALFAMFPGWLNSLPKSGGWMDNVKISLGFVELALALKFLSTADMVRHWGILKFELFIGLWLVIALLLGLYQMGWLGMKGAKGRPGPTRLAVALASFAFVAYLGNGLFNYKSLSVLSGIAPPVHYNYFRPMDCPHSLDCYHDFDEALAIAKLENKPLFIDFTGYGCVNCRKMEENVWHLPGIYEHLKNNYILVSLYVDDQERLFPDDKFSYLLDSKNGEKIRTIGDKWARFEQNNFGQISQPLYVLMHSDGKTLLSQPRGFTPNADEYEAFLNCGYDAFQRVKSGGAKEMIGMK